MNKVRMAIIGTGGMGSGHAKMVQAIEEVHLCAVSDIRPEVAQKVAEQFSIPAYSDNRAMLKKEKPDFVIVATPHPAHMQVALDAFAAGAHVLCEKPLASNLIEADKMIQAAEKRGKLLGTMLQMRTEPAKKKVREIVLSGILGKIYRVNMVASGYRSQAYYNSGAWRGTWAGEGGGVLINQAPHDLDQFIWLGGKPDTVTGRVDTRIHDIEVEDSASAMVTYPNGARGYIHVSTVEHPGTWQIEICGNTGKLAFDGTTIKLWLLDTSITDFTRNSTVVWSFPPVKEQPVEIPAESEPGSSEPGSTDAAALATQIKPGETVAGMNAVQLTAHAKVTRDFAHAIMENRQPLAPGREGILSLELANAIIFSSYKGKTVELPLNRAAYNRFFKEKGKTSRFKT